MGRVDGKVAIVTGGGSGIGRGAALALAAEGAKVLVTDIDDAGGAETVKQIKAAGGEARYAHQDVVEEDRWIEIVGEAVRTYGGLHILVNNAGIGIGKLITEMPLEDFQRQNAINVDGVFLGTKHAIPAMKASGGGSIINISSVAGLSGAAGLAGYCASKGAVRLFTKATAIECAALGTGVRANSIHPGIIETAIWNKIDQGGLSTLRATGSEGMDPVANQVDVAAIAAASTPLGVHGVPADIAAGVLYLASDESRFVTGSELVIDGGMTAR